MINEPRYVDLDRVFDDYVRNDRDRSHAKDLWHLELLERLDKDDRLRWRDLRDHARLVILGDARAGKSQELRQQAAKLQNDGEIAFYMTVDDLARTGLMESATHGGRDGIALWRERGGRAHFFIDSIDQARLNGRSLDTALGQLRQCLDDNELSRARIVLSCRYTDWRHIEDRQSVCQLFPLACADLPGVVQELAVKIVVLCSLDRQQMRKFVEAHELHDSDRFLRELAETKVDALARRPGDLLWLMEYWEDKKTIGSLTEVLSGAVRRHLREDAPDRKPSLSTDTARRAVEVLAGALALARADEIAVPTDDSRRQEKTWIYPLDYLGNLSCVPQTMDVLALRIFDPATFGRVQFQHRTLKEFLIAGWLTSLLRFGLSQEALRRMLFVEIHGRLVVRPQLAAAAAWLAKDHEFVRESLLKSRPQMLISEGDPAELPVGVREQALRAYLSSYSDRHCLPDYFDIADLQRFGDPGLDEAVRSLSKETLPSDRVTLLLQLVQFGKIRNCRDLALQCATDLSIDVAVRNQSIAAVGAVGLIGDKLAVIDHCLTLTTIHREVLHAVVEAFYLEPLTTQELLVLLEKPISNRSVEVDSIYYYWAIQVICIRTPVGSRAFLISHVRDIVDRLSGARQGVGEHAEFLYRLYGELIILTVQQWRSGDDVTVMEDAICDVAGRLGRRFGHQRWREPLRKALASNVDLLRALFEKLTTDTDGPPISAPLGAVWQPSPSDAAWLVEVAGSSQLFHLRRAAMKILLQYRRIVLVEPEAIARAIANDLVLVQLCKRILEGHRQGDEAQARWEQEQQERLEVEAQQRTDVIVGARENLAEIRSGADLGRLLWFYLCAMQDRRGSLRSLAALREHFEGDIVDAVEAGTRLAWRLHDLHLEPRHSLEAEFALTSVALDLQDALKVQSLDGDLARRAVQLGFREEPGIPEWMATLARIHPRVVRDAFNTIIRQDHGPRTAERHTRESLLKQMLRGPKAICDLCIDAIWELLEDRDGVISADVVGAGLTILRRCDQEPLRIAKLCMVKCEQGDDPGRHAVWWSAWFSLDLQGAVRHLESVVATRAAVGDEFVLAAAAHLGRVWSKTSSPGDAAAFKQLWSMITARLPVGSDRPRPGSMMDRVDHSHGWIIDQLARPDVDGGWTALLELAEEHLRYRDWLLARAERRLDDEALVAPNPVADYVLEMYRVHGTNALEHLRDTGGYAPALGSVDDECREFVDELARVFHRLEDAESLLQRVGFPMQSIPWRGDTPIVFWNGVVRALRVNNSDGVRALADEAARQYPGNECFQRFRRTTARA